ncbi:short-chain dehydrogenase/reductase family 16C member 6-like [Euwallacea similis]|uniref:short-chain dehydrogenase/reductase family 16C member 6-like n=1 Tax=Euwallacea similis TaxID=1736056 RepID=UPI00344CF849
MSTQPPILKVDNAQNVLKESNFQRKVIESFCVLGHILFFLVKLLYYWGEVIYLKLNPPPPTSVKGQIVLITGAGHGIGRELALAYSSRGAIVVGWDINKRNNDETIKEIAELGGRPKAYSFQCDITNREEVLKTAKDVQSLVGDVDILINNAGIMPCHSLDDHTPQEIEKIIAVNLTAHFWLLEAFLPNMKRKNQGHIVSISSMAGLIGFTNLVPYCATKFGVRGYMEALFDELKLTNPKNRIKMTVIFPYMVDTGLCKRPKIKYETLMPLLSPKDVAEEILDAQCKAKLEVTIPNYLGGLTLMGRCLPYNAAMNLKRTFEAIVESDM